MSYHIYTTPAFIVSSFARGEADRMYKIYTKDLGMIDVVAQGVRKVNSKLCSHLQDFRLLEISVVKGKEVWRATSAKESAVFVRTFENPLSRSAYSRILTLVARFIRGEEEHSDLFSNIESGFFAFEKTENTEAEILAIEYITVLRILNALGYIKEGIGLEPYLVKDMEFNEITISSAIKDKRKIILEINRAINESHL
ncbi:MAG: recombination protein O N-terminal domain-containing protein [bacterium]